MRQKKRSAGAYTAKKTVRRGAALVNSRGRVFGEIGYILVYNVNSMCGTGDDFPSPKASWKLSLVGALP